MLTLILLIAAFACFAVAVFRQPSRFNLLAAGLAFWVLANILVEHPLAR